MKTAKAFFLLSFSLILLFFINGCKDSTGPQEKTAREILTQSPWAVQKAYDVSSSPGQKIDKTVLFPFAYLQFRSDDSVSALIYTGSWQLNEAEKKLIMNFKEFGLQTADVLELSETLLRIKMPVPDEAGITIYEVTLQPMVSASVSPEVNFDTLWKEFDARYSFFELKKINWDSLYSVYRPMVTSRTTDKDLFQIMSSLLNTLKDIHVNLNAPFGTYGYSSWQAWYKENFPGIETVARYLSTDYGTRAGGNMRFGKIGNDIGYLYIGRYFMGNITQWSQAIDEVIDSLRNMKAMVIDIRNNGGGNSGLASEVVGRFADKERLYSYAKYRQIGGKHSDFTDYVPYSIYPYVNSTKLFLKPVALLTNRHCFSSAEDATLMFKVLPNVTIIGDTTGGGSGNPVTLQLPNGWTFRLSRWVAYTLQKETFEGIGLAPDIPVQISEADKLQGKDTILEYAVSFLRNK